MVDANLYSEYTVELDALAQKYNIAFDTLCVEWLKLVSEGYSPKTALFGVRRACVMYRPDLPDDYTLTLEEAAAICNELGR